MRRPVMGGDFVALNSRTDHGVQTSCPDIWMISWLDGMDTKIETA